MSSSTTAALRRPQSLAELLDARPDTREMISANLNLAHACLLLRQGDAEELERSLRLAHETQSPGLASISRCIRAEALRLAGDEEGAWDAAEQLAQEDRFDVVAALYLRHLFPLRRPSAEHASATIPVVPPPAPEPEPVAAPAPVPVAEELPPPAPPEPAPLPPPVVEPIVPPLLAPVPAEDSLADAVSVLHEDSEIGLPEEEPAVDAEIVGRFSPSLQKVAEDPSVALLRHRHPDGAAEEIHRAPAPAVDPEGLLTERSGAILARLGFGALLHAAFEGAEGTAHAWTRAGRSLILVVRGSSSAPALAARCTRALEELR